MDKKYWHELPHEEVLEIVSKCTSVKKIMTDYKQPDWCSYPDALEGSMGCWSLVSIQTRDKISEEYCSKCDCFRK